MKNNDNILDTLLTTNIIKLRDFTGLPFNGVRDSKDEFILNAVLTYDEEFHPLVLRRLWNLNKTFLLKNPEHLLTKLWLSMELEKLKKNTNKIIFRLTLPGVNVPEKYLNDHKDEKDICEFANFDNISRLGTLNNTIENQIQTEVKAVYSKITSQFQLISNYEVKLNNALLYNEEGLSYIGAASLGSIRQLFKIYIDLVLQAYPPGKYEKISNLILEKIFSVIKTFLHNFSDEIAGIQRKRDLLLSLFRKELSVIGKTFQNIFVNIQSQLEINVSMLNEPQFWELQLNNYHTEFTSIDSINLQDLEELLFNIEYYVGPFNLKIDTHLLIYANFMYAKFLLFLKNQNYELALQSYDKLILLIKNNDSIPIFLILNDVDLIVDFFQNLLNVMPKKEIDTRINDLRRAFNMQVKLGSGLFKRYGHTLGRDDWFEYTQGTIKKCDMALNDINKKLVSLNLPSKKKNKKKNKSKKLVKPVQATKLPLPERSLPDLKVNPIPRPSVTLVSTPPGVTIRVPQEVRDRDKEQKKNHYYSAHQSYQRRKSCDSTDDKKENYNPPPLIFTLESPLTGKIKAIISDQLRENLSSAKLYTIIEVLKKGKIGFKNNVVKPVFSAEKKENNLPAQVTHKIKATVKEGEEKGQLIRVYGEWDANSYLVFKHELKNPHHGNERLKLIKKENLKCSDDQFELKINRFAATL